MEKHVSELVSESLLVASAAFPLLSILLSRWLDPPGYPVSPFSGVYHPVRGSESGSFVILC